MRRKLVIGALGAVVVAVVVLLATGSFGSGGSGGYKVEALFDDAGFAVPGEQVRIAGANVGSISAVSVTKQNLAAVTMTISTSGFSPWYANATCTIRPQSLIAERYVDCEPGSASSAPLQEIKHGYGTGSYLLPVARTSSPIDVDIVQDISQDSVRESLSLILDELGTGLAARGSDLNAVILRANPALAATEKVFDVLGSQNKTLAQLAVDSDKVLAPLAHSRKSLADFIVQADKVAQATASQKQNLERSIALLPDFLTQLKPLMTDLGQLADEGTPDLQALGSSAGSLDTTFKELVPFAKESQSALKNLGTAADASEGSLDNSISLAQELAAIGKYAKPSAANLDKLTASLKSSGALQQLMGLLFYGAGATNGYDADGHYVRISPLVGSCTGYTIAAFPGCSANFSGSAAAPAAGTTETPAEVAKQARVAADDLYAAAGGSSDSTAVQADEAEVAAIAAKAVGTVSSSAASSSGKRELAGLLDYLIGSAGK